MATNDTKGGDSNDRIAIGTKAPGGLSLVCEATMSTSQFPVRELRLRLNEPRPNAEKRFMKESTTRAKSFSLNLSMKHSYHGPRRTSAVTARMHSAVFRSRPSLVRNICGTSSQC